MPGTMSKGGGDEQRETIACGHRESVQSQQPYSSKKKQDSTVVFKYVFKKMDHFSSTNIVLYRTYASESDVLRGALA